MSSLLWCFFKKMTPMSLKEFSNLDRSTPMPAIICPCKGLLCFFAGLWKRIRFLEKHTMEEPSMSDCPHEVSVALLTKTMACVTLGEASSFAMKALIVFLSYGGFSQTRPSHSNERPFSSFV